MSEAPSWSSGSSPMARPLVPPPINASAKPLPPPPLPATPLTYVLPTEMTPPAELNEAGNFARLAARLSWTAPAAAVLFLLVSAGAPNEPVGKIIAGVAVLILLAGLLFGLLALGSIRRHGRQGILGPAMFGLSANVAFLFVIGWLAVTFMRAANDPRNAQAAQSQPTFSFPINAAPPAPPNASEAITDASTAVVPTATADTADAPASAAPPTAAALPPSAAASERVPGWIGATDRTDLRIIVLQWHDDAPGRRKMRDLYAADSTIVTVIVNNSVGASHVTIDPASLEFHFHDYTTLKALPPKEILETAKFDREYYVKRYGGEWNVPPRQVRTDGLAFFPPGTDLTQARAVTMVLNGQRIVVPGKYCSADEKAHILEQLQVAR